MTDYVKIEDGKVVTYPYSIEKLRRDNPNTSFPDLMSDDALAAYGVHPVFSLAAPSIDAATQKLVQDAEPELVDGQWQIGWVVANLTAEELVTAKAAQEAARRAAYIAEADPLFFMSQRGEATTAEWEAKVAEIKARYPYPGV